MNTELKIIISYIAVMTAVSFCMCGIDKLKAKRQLWRIPESTLLLTAAAGGSLGLWAGMYVFRHKTLHKKFTIGVPLIICLQVIAAAVITVRLI